MPQGHYGFPNILQLVRTTSLKVLGQPGATAGASLVGGTTSGAPTSGTFEAGAAVVAQNGHLWICTASGTPGTWTDAGSAGSTLAIQHGGSAIATRPTLNLIDGTNVTLTVADNSGSNRVDATVAAAGGGTAAFSWVTKTTTYTLTTSDTGVLADASGGAFTLTLPTAVGSTARYTIKKQDTSANAVTVATTSSQTIDGATSLTITAPGSTLDVMSDGANWFMTAGRGQIGYAQITGNVTVATATQTDVSGLSVAVTVGSRPVRLTFFARQIFNGTSNDTRIELYDTTAAATISESICTTSGGNGQPGLVLARVAPAAGARSYKVQWRTESGGGTSTMTNDATYPAFILVEEL